MGADLRVCPGRTHRSAPTKTRLQVTAMITHTNWAAYSISFV